MRNLMIFVNGIRIMLIVKIVNLNRVIGMSIALVMSVSIIPTMGKKKMTVRNKIASKQTKRKERKKG